MVIKFVLLLELLTAAYIFPSTQEAGRILSLVVTQDFSSA